MFSPDKSTTYYHSISCSFPNNLTNFINYPKTRFCFGRLGNTLLEFIVVIIIILTHGIAYYSVHSCSPYGKKMFPQSTCISMSYVHMYVSNIWTIFDIIIFKLG